MISEFSKYLTSTRVQLLCDLCENDEKMEPCSGKMCFRFQGNRSYQLVVDRSWNILPWAFLFYINRERETVYWNEFRSIIAPMTYYNMDDYEEEDEDEEEDDDGDDDGDDW
jgi:hypothetical protein